MKKKRVREIETIFFMTLVSNEFYNDKKNLATLLTLTFKKFCVLNK